jgi:hypothetical protein
MSLNAHVVEAQDEHAGAGAAAHVNGAAVKVNGHTDGPKVNGHDALAEVVVSPLDTIPYQASGGDSEHREYEQGEGLTIEKHLRSFSVLWTAREPSPAKFMHRLGALVLVSSKGRVIVGPSEGARHPFAEVVADLDDGSLDVDFIHADFPEAAVTWQAVNGNAAQHPTAKSEIGIIWTKRSKFRPELLRALIDATATKHVADDVEGIIESTEQLTSDFKPVAS